MKVVRCRKIAALLFALSLAAFGCGEGDDEPNGGLSNGPSSNSSNSNNSNSNSDPDAGGDADVGADADTGGDADTGDNGGAPDEEGNHCGEPTDLGELAVDETHTFESSLLEPAGDLDTSCERDEAGETARVFSFEPDEDARLSIWSTVSPSQYDLREGGCESPEEVLTCSTTGTAGADLQGGQTYHLVIWGDAMQEDFDLELDLEATICEADEEPWCEPADNQRQECDRGTDIETADCIEECADETICQGDTCDTSLEVDLSSTSEATMTGNLGAYTDNWNAADLSEGECAFEESNSNPDTPEADTFFEVPGLEAGQTLTVDSSLSGDYTFFVLDTCGADSCLFALDDDDQGDQRLEWEVPADGDYTVVVEPSSGTERDFEFGISVD